MSIKDKLNEYPRFEPEQLIKKAKAYRVVSFDVFDTLLKRDVAAERDVFSLVERRFNRLHGTSLSGFCDMREKAESIVRERAGNREITSAEIYAQIAEMQRGQWEEKTVSEWMALEKEIEKAVSCPNLLIKEVYQYCLAAQKQILIISDMYLDKDFIASLLEKNGYQGYHALYVSSDSGNRKRDGSLFQYVLAAEHLKPDELLHIGDGKKADYLEPKRLGIRTAPIACRIRQTRYLTEGKTVDSGILFAFANNGVSSVSDRQTAVGYEVYGPLLYGFTSWLNERLDPKKTILFFARDCHIVMSAYRMLSGNEAAGIYFEGSRKSLIVPALWLDNSLEQVARLLHSEPRQMTLAGLLRKFGLDVEKYSEAAHKNGLSMKTVLQREQLAQHEAFVRFWNEVAPSIKADSEAVYRGFQAYFKSLNCADMIQVVDIGWRCTMQYCLKNLLPKSTSLHGYYLGVREDAFAASSEREGFFLSGENDEEKKAFLASMTALIEIFFSAPHGSVVGYEADGTPLYAEHECEQDEPGRKLVSAIQEGALRFVNDFSKSGAGRMLEADADLFFAGLREMGNKPHREELIAFGNYPFHMGVGVIKTAAPGSIASYVLHPKRLMYDFANSNWKIAFMKRLLKIELPYDRLFRFIYRHRG